MKGNPKLYLTFFISILAFIFLFPKAGYAVDFSITKVNIDAYLQENGQVLVKESHTYSFDGEFNGITREIVPKEGTSITKLKATENGNKLKVEREEDLYKIHRKGKDESITIELSYTIKNGVNVYSDVADFYWPFFDERNESTYENMSIIIHPPKETQNVIAFGYDLAFEKEKIHEDGSVLFQLGEVPSGENGDIRVAYETGLFPATNLTADKPMKNEILKDEQSLYDMAAENAEKKETLSTIALFIIPIFTIIIVLVMVGSIMRARMKKLDVERRAQQSFFVPKEALSIPATIYFTKGQIPTEAMAAALLDLVRKGYVSKTNDDRFRLENMPKTILKHERILISFLFNEIGSNGEFSFENLRAYTKKTRNHEKYRSALMKWQQAVISEVKENNLYEKNGKFRWLLVFSGFLLLPFLFLFPSYDLFGWFTATLILLLTYLIFAITFHPKSSDGLMIIHEWQLLKERMQGLSTKEWEALSDDDQMRAYIYGIGMNDKNIIKKNEDLIQSFKHPDKPGVVDDYFDWDSSHVNLNTMLIIGPLASNNFHYAHKTTESTTSSASSGSSGGGVGGGGGGSGAF